MVSADNWLDAVKWNEDGLAPVVTQDVGTGEILMLAWMSRESLARTVESGEMVYWSRSRKALWHKGDTSGHYQRVKELRLDCDADALLAKVEQVGGIACHTGRRACFFQKLENGRWVMSEAPGVFGSAQAFRP
jgi:phosphoribosyl-AMP cyclohydrolase